MGQPAFSPHFGLNATDVHLYSHDNALVMLERRLVVKKSIKNTNAMFTMLFMYSSQEENLLTSVISVHHFRLSLWDATNNSLVNSLIMLSHHIRLLNDVDIPQSALKCLLILNLRRSGLTFPNEGLPDLFPAPHPTSSFNWRAH